MKIMPPFVCVPVCARLYVCSRARLEMYVTAAPSPPAPNVQRRSCWSSIQLTPAALWGSYSRYNLIGAQHAGMGALLIKTFIYQREKVCKTQIFPGKPEDSWVRADQSDVCRGVHMCVCVYFNQGEHVTMLSRDTYIYSMCPSAACRRNTTNCRISLLYINSYGWQTLIPSQTWIHWSVQTDFSSFSHTSDADTRLTLFG